MKNPFLYSKSPLCSCSTLFFSLLLHTTQGVPGDCRNFLELCFRRDKSARPHAAELLVHDFVRAAGPGAAVGSS